MARHESLQPEIYPLTGIRAAAAIWVVLYHMQRQLAECYPNLNFLIKPIVAHGYLGVDLFFILSGFIIHYNYGNRLARVCIPAIGEFLWMRLARLWPVHAVILILFVVLLFAQRIFGMHPKQPELYSAVDFVKNVFLVQSWAIPSRGSWNVPAWSISCEWLAYLLYPILVVSRLCVASPRRSAVVATLALVGTALVCQYLKADGNVGYGLVRIAGEFLGGCALCHIFRANLTSLFPWQYIVPLAVVSVIIASHYMLPAFGLVAFWCVPLLGIIVLGLANHQCFVSRLCSTKLFLFGGYISYSLYMIHELCLIVLGKADAALGEFAPIIDILAIVIFASFLFFFVEQPCRKAMRNVFPRHKQQPYPVI